MKAKDFIIYLVILVVVGASTWAIRGEFYPKVINEIVTDTLRIPTPYTVEIIKEIEKPVTVKEYVTKYDSIEVVKVVRDTVFIQVADGTLTYHSKFLTNYPKAPKFLGLHAKNDYIEFTGLTINGNTIGKKYYIGQDNYKIGLDGQDFVGVERIPRKVNRFSHEIGAGWTQYWDTGMPYVKWEPRFTFNELSIGVSFYLQQEPYIQTGINYNIK